MKILIICLTLSGVLFYGFIPNPAEKSPAMAERCLAPENNTIEPFALMELFTSEGCSNCPPAYRVVEQLVKAGEQNHKHVYLLDFHVDYFNKPWVDPFSSEQNTDRQRSYVSKYPDAGLYTPAMVVNGNAPILGSDVAVTDSAVSSVLKETPTAKIKISRATSGNNESVNVRYETENIPGDSVINIVLVEKTVIQKVLAGENAGKTLTHHNVVRQMVTAPAKGGIVLLSFPKKTNRHDFSIIAFRQDLNTMKIVAASEKDVE